MQQLQAGNAAKLDEMRQTVDGNCKPRCRRVWARVKQVADRLEQVHKGLGEMSRLARGVATSAPAEQCQNTRHVWRGTAG